MAMLFFPLKFTFCLFAFQWVVHVAKNAKFIELYLFNFIFFNILFNGMK